MKLNDDDDNKNNNNNDNSKKEQIRVINITILNSDIQNKLHTAFSKRNTSLG